MVSDRAAPSLAHALMLALAGAAACVAWQQGFWATLTAALLFIASLIGLNSQTRARPSATGTVRWQIEEERVPLKLVLDQVPMPIIVIENGTARTLNRTARIIFATGDRILPPPPALVDASRTELILRETKWRLHRVQAEAMGSSRVIVTMVDVSTEERAAEARVSADMIQILGHELLNGLAPIVSLADSGRAAVSASPPRLAQLGEILGTLSTRAEGLFRFAESYRAMGRLPEPNRLPVQISALAQEFRQLVDGHWESAIGFVLLVDDDVSVRLDRDQITQAIWSLIQNAAEAALAGEGAPRVSMAIRSNARELTFEVSDSGPGVDPEAASAIFRPFHSTKLHGTGIGLTVARQIARAHGGELMLACLRPAVFRMTIPQIVRLD